MRRIKTSYMASAHCRAMPHKPKKYRKPAHRKCREKLPCISRLQAAGIFHVQHVVESCRTRRKSTESLRTASAASVSAELFMIAQTSEQRTLLTFCSAFAKCPKYGERLGAITQGEDLTNGTLRCAGVFASLRREHSAQALFACLRRERSAQAFSRLCGGSAVRRRFLQVCGDSAAHRHFRIYAPICRRS